jgi:fructosamine-3-kinase
MQPEILTLIQQIITRISGAERPVALDIHPVGGGSINLAYRVLAKDNGIRGKNNGGSGTDHWIPATEISETDNKQLQGRRQWFCKINNASRFPGLFEKERDGLTLLAARHIFRVPAVIACETSGSWQILLLEWIQHSPAPSRSQSLVASSTHWRLFGEQLARLHQVSRSSPSAGKLQSSPPADMTQYSQPSAAGGSGSFFGLASGESNYMGALLQSNDPSPNWVSFFIHQRLEPQIRLAVGTGLLEKAAVMQFERLYQRLPDLFPDTAPSLLHGDLWSGNFLFDEQGRPVLIDPAVYFGDRNMDLAMTTLFGGFDREFYESYAYYSPLPSNHQELWDICNLYPLLIHLNLFGKSYLSSILDTIQSF